MPYIQAVNLLGITNFKIWQRKNTGVTEPFATGLFARKQGDRWERVFARHSRQLPFIHLATAGVSEVAVLQKNGKLGLFDEVQGIFKHEYADGEHTLGTGSVINSEPPDHWWLRQAVKR